MWPEGDGFPEFLSGLVGEGSVLEFGCGIGRLAGCFDPECYLGVDVSTFAIAEARLLRPSHRFQVIDDAKSLPASDVTLAHTVLLHVPDDALQAVVDRFESPRLIISEILGRHWRRTGNPPVFNREMSDYEAVLSPRYRLTGRHFRPYPHYADTMLTVMEFAKC